MTTMHLSEVELQQAADAAFLPAAAQTHLRACRRCQAHVAAYQQVFIATAGLPKAQLDFDATALVLAQLPRSRPPFPWIIVLACTLGSSVLLVALRWLGNDFAQAFQGLSPAISTAAWVLVGCFTASHCGELLLRYRRQMSQLATT
jgi:anti-sigma factor RsiW